MPKIILDSVTTANQRIVRQQVTKKEIVKMIFGPADNIVQWQQVGKDDDYDGRGWRWWSLLLGMTVGPRNVEEGRRCGLTAGKFVTRRLLRLLSPLLPPTPLLSPLLRASSHLISPIASHLRPRHSRFNSAKLDANGIRSVQMIQQGLVEPAWLWYVWGTN